MNSHRPLADMDVRETCGRSSAGGCSRVARRRRGAVRGGTAAAAILVGVGMLGMALAYEAPVFMDYREAGTHACDVADGCKAITDVASKIKTPSPLPIVTPPDGHVFYGRIGDEISFHIAGQHNSGELAKSLSILFEEDPSLLTGGAFEYTQTDGSSAIFKTHVRVYNELIAQYASFNPIARLYALTVKKFAPSKDLTMCFRIMADCSFPYNACPAEDPAAPCGEGVDPLSCVNCCFKDPPQDPFPMSIIYDGMEKGTDGNSDAPTTAERRCFQDDKGRCFNSRFYPRRCVRMYVAEAPQIVNVLPEDHSQVAGKPVVKTHAKAWLHNSTGASVHVKAGQILRLNIDAADPNEEDDVDIKIDAGVTLPQGAALGPRMCCNSAFEDCHVMPFGSHTCSSECKMTCSSEKPTHHTNTTLASECVEECSEECVRNPCNYVRRQMLFQPTPDLTTQYPDPWTGLKFVAFDDSGRLASHVDGLCCAALDLESQWEFAGTPLAAGVTVRTSMPRAAFTDPLPVGVTRLPDAFVNCPMPALSVHAFSAIEKNVFIVPDGCQVGYAPSGVPVLPPTLSEGCTTGQYCDMCYPNFPKGVQVLGQGTSMWASTNFSWDNHTYRSVDLRPYYIAGAEMTVMSAVGAGNSSISIVARANVVPPPGSTIVIEGVHATRCTGTPAVCTSHHAERGEAMCRIAMGGGTASWNVATVWSGSSLHLHVVWPVGATSTSMDPSARMHVDCTFVRYQVQMDIQSTIAFDSTEAILKEGQYPPVSTTPAPFTSSSNGTATFWGGGPNSRGVGVSRLVRWTPARGQEGQEYQFCFSAIGWTNVSSAAVKVAINLADHRCFVVRVVRCKYCTLPGDTLESISSIMHTSWLQLWGPNSGAGMSSNDFSPGTMLTLGVLHHVPKDMMITDIALQFATSEEAVRALNPDLPSDQAWVGMGREVCLVPGVCDSSVAPDGSGVAAKSFGVMSSSMPDHQ